MDLGGAGGNVAVVGAPQSGKSAALRTVMCALAARHSPQQVQFYCLDFGGGSLTTFRELPHVGMVVTRTDAELVARTVNHVSAILAAREAGNHSAAGLYGEVFLVVDGWSTVREEFGELEATITALAVRG